VLYVVVKGFELPGLGCMSRIELGVPHSLYACQPGLCLGPVLRGRDAINSGLLCFAIGDGSGGSNTTMMVLLRRHGLNIQDSVVQAVPFLDDFDQSFCVCGATISYQIQDTLVGIQFILDGLLLCYAGSSDAVVAHCGL